MSKRLIIVGGVAGGATAAARARRLDEQAEIIVIERGKDVSFANCGLPYHIGAEIPQRSSLRVQTRAGLMRRFGLDIRTRHEVTAIDPAARVVHVRDLADERDYTEHYDNLLLSPGAAPIRPPLPGADHPAIFTLRDMTDMDRIKGVVDSGAKSAVVVGGGFIGLEMAENLVRRGLTVALVELLPQVMPPLDPEIAAAIHQELHANGVALHLADAVTAFEDAAGRVRVQLRSGKATEADLVILAVGVRPEAGLARDAGLTLTERGAIVVDEHMRTSDPHIYAVGDAVEVTDPVLGGTTLIPLAGPANRQARMAVDNIFGRPERYRGTQGTSVLRVFGLTVAATGAAEKLLRQRGAPYRKVYVSGGHHVSYFPGAERLNIKLLFSPDAGRILGAQVFGGAGVDKRIDVLALAVQARLTVADIAQAELAYSPPYGAAKDPVNMAGFVAGNLLRGDEQFLYAEELDAAQCQAWTIVDVREPTEYEVGHLPGARLLPLGELREYWQQLPTDKPVLVCCDSGQRSYYASRFLQQKGFEVRNLAGGMFFYRLVHDSAGPGATTPRAAASVPNGHEVRAAASPCISDGLGCGG